MANDPNPTNPQPVEVTPVSNVTSIGSQMGTSSAPLASGARSNFGRIGNIPSAPTPIVPIRRK